MKNLFIIILTAATISVAYSKTTDKTSESYTSAEQDFISACIEKETTCFSDEKTGCCIPEVIVIDQNDQIFSKGDKNNEVIKRFILISDFLTEVQGTDYYRINTMTPAIKMTEIVQK